MQIKVDEKKLLWLGLFIGAIFVRHALIATLIPFILALVVAALIDPIVNFFQNKVRLPRSAAAIVSLILVLLTGTITFLFLFTKVVSELIQMGSLLQRYQRVPVDFTTAIIERLNDLTELFDREGLPSEVQRNLLQTVEGIAKTSFDLLSQGISIVLKWATQVPFFFVVGVISLLATYFLVKDRDMLVQSFIKLSPPRIQREFLDAWQRIIVDLVNYLKAQALLISLTTVVVAIGLILIGIDYWVTMALIAGFLDLVPLLGPGFLFLPWAIGAITLGDTALGINLLSLFTFSFLVRQLFQAKLLGDSIGIHPLNMLVALYAGVQFFGVQGFIVAPFLVIVGKAVYTVRTQRTHQLDSPDLVTSESGTAQLVDKEPVTRRE